MRVHSESVRRYAPPLADRMTVCSERQREFWLRAGAEAATVTVTGQPRFDYYLRPESWPTPGGRSTDRVVPVLRGRRLPP